MKNKLFTSILTVFFAIEAFASSIDYQVIPKPQNITMYSGDVMHIDSTVVIVYPKGNEKIRHNAELLSEYLSDLTGIKLTLSDTVPATKAIILTDTLANPVSEAYELSVDNRFIHINGTSPAGNFYGIQTLRKAIDANKQGVVSLSPVRISDSPRFTYRGAHLDVARHFFPVDSIKKFIDVLALHNVNRFHWHLTDDQGWRLEIKKYPRLTEIGANRKGLYLHRTHNSSDTLSYCGYYTQEDVRDIVQYASERYVTIIPEIDLPGHMLAALASYPELGCTGGPYQVWTRGGVSEDVLCIGNDASIRFIDDILAEVVGLFPSEYIHLGGDECPVMRWKECPKCQERIRTIGLEDDSISSAEQKLQSYAMKHASETLASYGRRMIGWDEIIDGGLFPGSTVMSWRGIDGAIKASASGHDAILTPALICYFSSSQTENRDGEPYRAGGFLPLKKVYDFEPTEGVSPKFQSHIIGVQSCLWTEGIIDLPQALYQELPRMAALAEVQWSDPAQKDYDDFTRRLIRLCAHYRSLGLPFGTHIFDVEGSMKPDTLNRTQILTLKTIDDYPMRYTLDGTMPSPDSPAYSSPIVFDRSTLVKARVFRPSGESRIYADSVTFCKSTFCDIALSTVPAPKYSVPAYTLVDGIFGGNGYDTGKWMGFEGTPLIATIDLGKQSIVSEVNLHTFVSTSTWIFDADSITVELSTDGKTFSTVYDKSFDLPESNETGIRLHALKFKAAAARFVRIKVGCVNEIPQWHEAGKGKPAFLFLDEILVK